jgi:hypothetical protein
VFGRALWRIITTFGDVTHFMYDAGESMVSRFRKHMHDLAVYTDVFREAWIRTGHEIGAAADKIITVWDQVRHSFAVMANAIRQIADNIVTFFRGLPGRILSALGNLGHLLWDAGASLIRGLISGVESAIPGLTSVIGWVHSLLGGSNAAVPGNAVGGAGGAVTHAFGGGGRHASAMSAAAMGSFARPFTGPHYPRHYGHDRITNQFIPERGEPRPREVVIRNGAELVAVLGELLRDHARIRYGGSAQRAYGYGPG